MNYYAANQWELGGRKLHWDAGSNDRAGCRSISCLTKYNAVPTTLLYRGDQSLRQRPGAWLYEIAPECVEAPRWGCRWRDAFIRSWIALTGRTTHWHNCGLWDLQIEEGHYQRILNGNLRFALSGAQPTVEQQSP